MVKVDWGGSVSGGGGGWGGGGCGRGGNSRGDLHHHHNNHSHYDRPQQVLRCFSQQQGNVNGIGSDGGCGGGGDGGGGGGCSSGGDIGGWAGKNCYNSNFRQITKLPQAKNRLIIFIIKLQ